MNMPSELIYPMIIRVLGGFFSDVLLFMAFEYTTYSKSICLFFTNTLMIPFFGRCILDEPVRSYDIFAIIIAFGGMLMII